MFIRTKILDLDIHRWMLWFWIPRHRELGINFAKKRIWHGSKMWAYDFHSPISVKPLDYID